ncbi:hypothetical protein ACNJR2_21190, partial [Mycobacterium tuberculosis]
VPPGLMNGAGNCGPGPGGAGGPGAAGGGAGPGAGPRGSVRAPGGSLLWNRHRRAGNVRRHLTRTSRDW